MATKTNKSEKNTASKTLEAGQQVEAKDWSQDQLKSLGFGFGNPIYSKEVGDEFQTTLNGKIEAAAAFGERKPGVYLLTTDGYRMKANGGYNHTEITAGRKVNCICKMAKIERKNAKTGKLEEVEIPYTAFVSFAD